MPGCLHAPRLDPFADALILAPDLRSIGIAVSVCFPARGRKLSLDVYYIQEHCRPSLQADPNFSRAGTRTIPMSRVAVMMSENQVKAPMSAHFGKAEWVMAADTESHTFVFLKNDAVNGKSVADLVASQGCTDAVFNGIGNGALAHLKECKRPRLGCSSEYQRTTGAGDVRASAATTSGFQLRGTQRQRMLLRKTGWLRHCFLLPRIACEPKSTRNGLTRGSRVPQWGHGSHEPHPSSPPVHFPALARARL